MRRTHFLRHSPCPKCGSKDNLALYSDGSGYCFGCGFVQRGSVWNLQTDSNVNELTNGNKLHQEFLRLRGLESVSVQWLEQFGVTVPEAISRGVTTDSYGRTCFVFKDKSSGGGVFLIQARNHDQTKKSPKYITYGKPDDCLPLYYVQSADSRSDCLVLVEDCISAIKVARLSDSMPILGSDLSLRKLSRLKALYGRFRVWLDSDMYHKACKMASRLELMGCEAKAVYSELDPKCYNDEEIKSYLKLDMS